MKIRRSAAIAGLAGVAMVAGLAFVGTGAAYAATTPPYEPDPQSNGTLAFYDAGGNQITSGNINTAPMAAYVVGSAPGRAGDNATLLNMAQPNPAKTTDAWNADTITGATSYPLSPTGNPPNIVTLSQTHPVSKGTAGDFSIAGFIAEFPNDPAHDSTASYQNLYQLRLITANGSDQNPQYEVADILVSGSTWTQVYPAVATATSTVLTSSANPTTSGTSITLTATESPAAAGSVQFKDGAANLGSAVAVNGSGVATLSQSFSTTGPHSLSAVFTPTDTGSFAPSTGNLTETVNPPATPTTTALSVSQDGVAGDDVKLTATVSPSAAGGSVSFTDNGNLILGTPTQGPAGTYVLDLPAGLAGGNHSVVASFSPSDVTQYEASNSAPQQFFLQAPTTGACAQSGSNCSSTANIRATVPVGTLVISTPWTAANPLVMPDLALTSGATMLTTSASFGNIVITDGRSGDLPYTVSASSSDLTFGGHSINSQNLGLTGLTAIGSGGYAGTTVLTDHAAASPPALEGASGSAGLGGGSFHTIVQTDHGVGTLTVTGTLTINAPTSTVAGTYNGAIVFTVG